MKAGTRLQAFVKDQMSHVRVRSVPSALLFHFPNICLRPLSRLLPLHNKSPSQVSLVPQLLFLTSVLAVLDILHFCVNLAIRSLFPLKSLLGFRQIKLGSTDIWRQSWRRGCGESLLAVKSAACLCSVSQLSVCRGAHLWPDSSWTGSSFFEDVVKVIVNFCLDGLLQLRSEIPEFLERVP